MSIPTITTAHLILRPFTIADIDPLHHILSDRDVIRYLPNTKPRSRDQVESLIAGQLSHWQTYGLGLWVVEWRLKNVLIGWSGLRHLPETKEVEVAYLLRQAFWGQGLATEAAKACLQYGFVTLELNRIIALTHPENGASQRVIEKLGLSFVDQARYFNIDCYRYAIERSSFTKINKKANKNG